MKVRVNDLRLVPGGAYCHRGARAFAQRHNLDWQDFVKNGIDAEVLRQTGDAMAVRIVEAVEQRDGR